eukprot:scaffold155724_cov22-Tisochrysis_lutea.AAC.1
MVLVIQARKEPRKTYPNPYPLFSAYWGRERTDEQHRVQGSLPCPFQAFIYFAWLPNTDYVPSLASFHIIIAVIIDPEINAFLVSSRSARVPGSRSTPLM